MAKTFRLAVQQPILLILFFLSGAAALIYQTVWIRYFGQVFGVDVFATSTVLTAFMAGLALGNLLFGKIVDRRANALPLFILLELGIGIFALLFPLTFKGLNFVYVLLHQNLSLGFYATQIYRFVLAFLFLLIPTTLMGGTLPVLSKVFVKRINTLGWNVGRLYSVNNLGALAGCFLAGFVLLRAIGHQNSIFLGAGMNILNALVVFVLWRFSSLRQDDAAGDAPTAEAENPAEELPTGIIRFILWAFAIEGFTTLAYEVVWTRILIGFSYDKSIYFYTTVILSFIFGLSLGSIIIAKFIDKRKNLLVLFGLIEVLIGLFAVLILSVFVKIAAVLDVQRFAYTENWWGSLGREYMYFFLAMILPTTLMGMTFPIVGKICTPHLQRLGARIGQIGFLDTAGSIFGAFVAGFILIPLLGVIKSVVFAAVINVVIGLAAITIHPQMSKKLRGGLAGSALAVFAVLLIFLPGHTYFQHWQTSRVSDRLLYYHEGADATVAVPQHNDGEKCLAINGSVTAFANYGDIRVHKMLGYTPYFLHPNPKNALVIGLGMGITAQSLLQPEIEQVDCVEINPGVVEAAANYFAGENKNVVEEEKLNIILDDGRSYLHTTTKKYDIITSNAVHARLSGNLYTKEFYDICRKRLTEDGVMCQWTSTNWLTPTEFASLVTAFQAAFPHTSLWLVNAGHLLIVGTSQPLAVPVTEWTRRFAQPKVQEDLRAFMLNSPEAFLAHFVADERRLPSLVQNAPQNTDEKPIAELSRVVSKMQVPEVVLGLIQVKHDLVDRLYFTTEGLEEMTAIKQRVTAYSEAEKYYLEGAFAVNFYNEPLLALNMLTQAVALIPDDYRYHEEAASVNLALAQQPAQPDSARLTFLDNAIEHLQAMTAQNPEFAYDWNNLGFVYLNRGDLEKARAAFARAIALAPEVPLPRIYYASILAGGGDAAGAEAELNTALKHFPKEPEAWYRLGLLYEYTNQREKAVKALRRVVDLDEQYRDAAHRLGRLKQAISDE